jgi:tetratricopeptide (TPR) repeat protein
MKERIEGSEMNRNNQTRGFLSACLALLLGWSSVCAVQGQDVPELLSGGIPLKEITALQEELAEVGKASSSIRKRRACKGVIRDGEAILKASPSAPNRFQVLAIVLETQKKLLGLENSERNREALLKTCEKLARASDEYAEFRLEADLLLSERDLALKNADLKERTEVLTSIVERYRSTSAEAKSLMMAARIAPKLEADELERTILQRMGLHFAGDPEVIEFRRKHLGSSKLDVLFAGTFTRADGVTLRFPHDLMGRQSVMVFWSRQTPGFEAYLKQIKEQEDQFPDRFKVFSFNVDELPDAGSSTLKSLSLNWTVMRLPGGKKNQAYQTYAVDDPVGILVNAYGHALLAPTMPKAAEQAKLGVRGVASPMQTLNRRLDDPRYLSQLQSLLIGDVLVTEPDGRLDATLPPELKMIPMGPGKEAGAKLVRMAESVPAETLHAIQDCFTPAPFRYRLSTAEALANYEKAEKLCGEAVRQHSVAPDLWIVRNRRIIALLGMWNLAGEPRYLEQAAREARSSLAAKLPIGVDIVARFCLAKEALRLGDSKPESVILDLIEKTGGAEAPCSAHAAATILALHANARDLHDRYCAPLLAAPDGGNPVLWPMVSFLRDRIYSYRLLKANYLHNERESVRGYMINHGGPPMTGLLPKVTLKTLDGRTLNLPEDTKGKLTLLVFVEPSAEPDAEFPIDVGEGEDKKPHHNYLQYACDLADRHVNKDVRTIVAFLSEDTERINALMETRELTCQAAIVPGGLANPMVRRLGVLSADRIPNVFLLRRDGSIVWSASGLPYGDSEKFVNLLATKVHIETCEVETAYEALNKGDFKEAARIFGGPYLPFEPDRFGWRPPRYHGKALAYMGMKDWKAALESIEVAIEAQNLNYLRGRKREKAPNWRKDAAKVTVVNPDDVLVELWATKAVILAKLGRNDESAQIRERYAKAATTFPPSVYKAFHEKLMELKMRNQIDKQ